MSSKRKKASPVLSLQKKNDCGFQVNAAKYGKMYCRAS